MRAYVLRLAGLAVAWWAKIDQGSEELAKDARGFESWCSCFIKRDENVWLSEVNVEGPEKRLPR